MGRASDPMTINQMDNDKSKSAVRPVDPYEFLDESDNDATEKLSASDLMMEPGTLSKQKLDTADLKMLDSVGSLDNEMP